MIFSIINRKGKEMDKLKEFVEGKKFSGFILVTIIINSIVLGLQTSSQVNASIGDVLSVIDTVCLVIFIIEMLLKMVVYRFFGYFRNPWNVFDFCIILLSILSGLAVLSSLRVLRVFRVFRSLKGLRGFKMASSLRPLQVIISAIGKSLPGISWAMLLMVIVYYIFSIIGVTIFGEAFDDWFGNIPKAMYTLFQVMTLESWSMGISRPVMDVFPAAWAYFVPFVLVSSFIMMNVIVGIVVNAISEVAEGKAKAEAKEEAQKSSKDKQELIKDEIAQVKAHLEKLENMLKN